jgi:hypothetical protein
MQELIQKEDPSVPFSVVICHASKESAEALLIDCTSDISGVIEPLFSMNIGHLA